jgi:hypothetical protein
MMDENGDLLADSHNVLNTRKNYFSRLLDVHNVSDVRQIEIREAVRKFPEFFDIDCLLHRELVPPGQSVTVQVVQRKRRDKWQAGPVVSAPNHTSLVVRQFIPVVAQPPHFPDLGPIDFWLFPTLKMGLRGDTFRNRRGQQMKCDGRTPEDSYRSLPTWQGRWSKCLHAQVSYCKGDWVSLAVCPTITVQYHHSGNFLTTSHTYDQAISA